jgi:hypothetical protein
MAGPVPSGQRRPRRRRGILLWVAVACVAAAVIEVGAVTSWFGLPALLSPHGGGSTPSGPNPNPFNENITGIWAQVTYTNGNRSSFPALQGTNLCSGCPKLPPVNRSYDPPVSGIWFYFAVTNYGKNATSISNFTLSTSGADPSLFRLVGVVCCAPTYQEVVTSVYFTSMTSFSLAAYAVATAIPNDGSLGYALYFNVTAP